MTKRKSKVSEDIKLVDVEKQFSEELVQRSVVTPPSDKENARPVAPFLTILTSVAVRIFSS